MKPRRIISFVSVLIVLFSLPCIHADGHSDESAQVSACTENHSGCHETETFCSEKTEFISISGISLVALPVRDLVFIHTVQIAKVPVGTGSVLLPPGMLLPLRTVQLLI